jgi:hypothetical protein
VYSLRLRRVVNTPRCGALPRDAREAREVPQNKCGNEYRQRHADEGECCEEKRPKLREPVFEDLSQVYVPKVLWPLHSDAVSGSREPCGGITVNLTAFRCA